MATFNNHLNLLNELTIDFKEISDHLLNNYEDQRVRRNYTKTLFSTLEGVLYGLKQICTDPYFQLNLLEEFSVEELLILREQAPEVTDKGEIKNVTRFLPVVSNLKFTIKMVEKLLNIHIDLKLGFEGWRDFQEAVKIRNRITHPRSVEELTITLDELGKIHNGADWFNNVLTEVISATDQYIDAQIRKLDV